MRLIIILLALVAFPARADCFRVGGRCAAGLDEGQQAVAMMHAGWSAAVPLVGNYLGGRRGLWVAGGTWLALNVVHNFALNRPASRQEARTDLATKFLPCSMVLTVDLFRH